MNKCDFIVFYVIHCNFFTVNLTSKVCVCLCECVSVRERETEVGFWGKEQEERRGDWGSRWKGREVRTTYLPPSPSISLGSQFLSPSLRPPIPSPLLSPSPPLHPELLPPLGPAWQQLERYADTPPWPAHSRQKSPGICWGGGSLLQTRPSLGRPTLETHREFFRWMKQAKCDASMSVFVCMCVQGAQLAPSQTSSCG